MHKNMKGFKITQCCNKKDGTSFFSFRLVIIKFVFDDELGKIGRSKHDGPLLEQLNIA
jgi:hypothetical protein